MLFTAPRIALATGLAAFALGCTALADQSGAPERGPLSCSVDVTGRGGMLTLEGVVTSNAALSGEYRLRVERRGTLMNQGGPFRVAPGIPARVGQVTLNGPASGLDAELTLEVSGRTYRCPVDL
ncbi:hypothetical protein HKCCSP123_00600 [Rhodobacterales bacterium HKCCSP123]|nr:hypothetical protein [Rhodobacterales bacterium HKCCSP123]